MGNSSQNHNTPFTQETPRRDAMRAMSAGVAGAALLGALGLASAPAPAAAQSGKRRKTKAEKKGKKGKAGPQGPAGANGVAGPQGPTGQTGPTGPISLAGLVVSERNGQRSTVASNQTFVLQAACNADEILIGGGYNLDDTLIAPCEIIAVGIEGGNWGVEISCPGNGTAENVRASALCLGLSNT